MVNSDDQPAVAERARRYTVRVELVRDRPFLNPDAEIPLSEVADLTADYRLQKAEWVRCQLVDENGRCTRLHGWGWVAKLADRTEGYIGHDCVDSHFGKDQRFDNLIAQAAARIDREITTDDLVRRLERFLADSTLRSLLAAARVQWTALNDRILNLRNRLPSEVMRNLRDRLKRKNTLVEVRTIYIEWEDDKRTGEKRQRRNPIVVSWAHLSGLEAIRLNKILKIGARLVDAEAALQRAIASIDQPLADLRKWATALEYSTRVDQDLTRIQTAIDEFHHPQNLKLLWLLEPRRVDQLAVVRSALELATSGVVSDAQAIAARDAWEQEIMDAHDGRAFEIVG